MVAAVDTKLVKVVDTVWVKVAAVDSVNVGDAMDSVNVGDAMDSVNAGDAMDSVAISVAEVSGMVAGGVQNAVGGTTGADIVVRGTTGAKIGGEQSQHATEY